MTLGSRVPAAAGAARPIYLMSTANTRDSRVYHGVAESGPWAQENSLNPAGSLHDTTRGKGSPSRPDARGKRKSTHGGSSADVSRRLLKDESMNQRSIGVFDSGLGGLTVVRALQEHLPHETLVYF